MLCPFGLNDWKMRLMMAIVLLLATNWWTSAFAQTTYGRIVSFDFSNTSGFLNNRPSQFNNTTYVDTSVIVKSGSLLSPINNTNNGNFIVNNYFVASGFTANNEAQAIAMNSFVEFVIKPKAGYEFRLDSLWMRWRSATSGVNTIFVRTSHNNYSTTVASDTITRGGAGFLKLGLSSPITSDSAITVRIYAYGSAASQNFGFGEKPISTINPDIEARGRMTAITPISTLASGIGSYTVCQGNPIWLKHTATHGTPPFTLYFTDAGNHRYQVSLNNETDSFQVYPEANWTYTLDSIIDVNGHKATSKSGSVNVQVQAGTVPNGVVSYTYTHPMTDGSFRTFANGATCNAWATIVDSLDGIELGSVNVGVQTFATSPFNTTSRFFLPRKINVSANQPGNAQIRFFIPQSDFDSYNAQSNYQMKMPVDSNDGLNNRANIRIAQTANSYESNALTFIQPESVSWNSIQQSWEVVYRVNGTVMNGNYYITSPFSSTKMVGAITHSAPTPISGSNNAVVTINWDDVPGVTQYRFRFRPQGTLNWNVSTITGSERTYNFLSFNSTYEVQVRVYENATTQGEYSAIYTFTTPLAPNKLPDCVTPSITVQSTTTQSATISWNSVPYAQTYQVQIRPKNAVTWGGTSTGSNQWTFTSLSPSTTYEYRVRTQCAAGQTEQDFSAFSSVDTFRTADAIYCVTPQNIVLQTVGSNNATLSWDAPNYASTYIVQSRVKNTLNWGGTTVLDNSYSLNNLSPNTTYEFRLRAQCEGGLTENTSSAFSAPIEFTTLPATLGVCAAPQINNITVAANQISISWDAVSNGALYFVQFKPQSSLNWGGGSTANTQYTWNNLSPNTPYQVRIRTTCDAGTTLTPSSVFSTIQTINTSSLKSWAPSESMVYPNPTQNEVNVTRAVFNTESLHVRIVDLSGRCLANNVIELAEGQQTWSISMIDYAPGFYFLHTDNGQGDSHVYKIQRK